MTTTGQPDEEIIIRILKGEQSAFSLLVEKYQNYVFTLVLRFTENREDAEEIAQDVFVKAYRSLADFRKKKLDTQSLDNERTGLQVENRESTFNANLVEQKSRHTMLNQAISMLSVDDAQVLNLFYKAEQTLEEIGKIMRLDSNTVKVKLHRARQRLKEKMEKHFAHEVREIHAD